MQLEDNKELIQKQLPNYLDQLGLSTRKNFRCLNPSHNDHNPSMAYDQKNNRVVCFGCGAKWDIFDLIAVEELGASVGADNTPDYDFKDAYNKAIEALGLSLPPLTGKKDFNITAPGVGDGNEILTDTARGLSEATGASQSHSNSEAVNSSANQQNTVTSEEESKQAQQIRDVNRYFIDKAQTTVDPGRYQQANQTEELVQEHQTAMDYLKKRGLSLAIANRFRVGFLQKWQSPTAVIHGYKPKPTPRLIIPTGETSYIARDVRDNIPNEEQGYKKMKEGPVGLFNIQTLKKSQPIFIVEGEIDAMSIMETGVAEAIGLGSTANVGMFIQAVKRVRSDHLNTKDWHPTFLIALDNDEAGQKAANSLIAQLKMLHLTNYQVQIARGHKDANEALVANRDQFTQDLQNVLKDPDNRLQGLLDFINQQSNVQAIPTGFKTLDKILDGGLYEGLYVVGAVSSLGKTTFVLQMCDYMAELDKRPVLYFALEMGQYEMMLKSISRLTFENTMGKGPNLPQTARSLMHGQWKKRYNQDQYENTMAAFKEYGDYYTNIMFHDGSEERYDINQIAEIIDSYVARTGKRPVVVVDYLQILKAADPKATDKANVTTSINTMKKIATKYHIPVIAISSFNRANYKEGATMESFKESGEIEYSSDVLITLQFQGLSDGKELDFNEEKKKNPREIEAVILKNRMGATGDKVPFLYYPMFNKFIDRQTYGDEPSLSDKDEPKTTVDADGRVWTPTNGLDGKHPFKFKNGQGYVAKGDEKFNFDDGFIATEKPEPKAEQTDISGLDKAFAETLKKPKPEPKPKPKPKEKPKKELSYGDLIRAERRMHRKLGDAVIEVFQDEGLVKGEMETQDIVDELKAKGIDTDKKTVDGVMESLGNRTHYKKKIFKKLKPTKDGKGYHVEFNLRGWTHGK